MNTEFNFFGERLTLQSAGNYPDGTPRICVMDSERLPYATLTVFVEKHPPLGPNQYIVKTWSENEPVSKVVLGAGLFKDTGVRIPTGFVEAQIWELVK